jgi:hypothetical protein
VGQAGTPTAPRLRNCSGSKIPVAPPACRPTKGSPTPITGHRRNAVDITARLKRDDQHHESEEDENESEEDENESEEDENESEEDENESEEDENESEEDENESEEDGDE